MSHDFITMGGSSMSTTTAYLRVSTDGQDLKNQRYAILDYADRHGIRVDTWMEVKMSSRRTPKERRIDDLVDSLSPGDCLLVSELSRLGRSVGQIITLVDELVKKQISVIVIKQGIKVNGKRDIATTTLITMLGLFAEIERELISERTRMGLAKARRRASCSDAPKGLVALSWMHGCRRSWSSWQRGSAGPASPSSWA